MLYLAEDGGGGEAGALDGPAVGLLVGRRVEAGAHVHRHEEPAAGARVRTPVRSSAAASLLRG